jgi:hypothetical protein
VIEFDAKLFIPVAPKLDRTFGQFGVFFIRSVRCTNRLADIGGGGERMGQRPRINERYPVTAPS